MKRLLTGCMLVALFGCSTTSMPGTGSEAPPASAEVASATYQEDDSITDLVTVTVIAEVTAVDKKTRIVSLKGAKGEILTFKATDAVTRLNEIEVGDAVVVDYIQSVAYELREPTPEEKAALGTVSEFIGKSDLTEPPGAGMVRQIQSVVKIVSIDQKAETVTIRSADGTVSTVVARHPERLKLIKAGDTVAITFTEAVAVSIEPHTNS